MPPGTPRIYSYKDYDPAPRVMYCTDPAEADRLVEQLSGPVGFDMEWKFYFARRTAVHKPVAVIQVADEKMILVVQISAMKMVPPKLKALTESADIPKMGANIHNDGKKLYQDYGVLARNLVELGAFAKVADPACSATFGNRKIVALARIVEHYCDGKTLDKGPVRSSDWERPLTAQQVDYAANDAYCAIMAYKRMQQIAKQNEVVFDGKEYYYTQNVSSVFDRRPTVALVEEPTFTLATRPDVSPATRPITLPTPVSRTASMASTSSTSSDTTTVWPPPPLSATPSASSVYSSVSELVYETSISESTAAGAAAGSNTEPPSASSIYTPLVSHLEDDEPPYEPPIRIMPQQRSKSSRSFQRTTSQQSVPPSSTARPAASTARPPNSTGEPQHTSTEPSYAPPIRVLPPSKTTFNKPLVPGMIYTSEMAKMGMQKQHLRAYRFWHIEGKTMEQMCRDLSTRGPTDPLKAGTVISYVVGALQKDNSLPFDRERLHNLVRSDAGSWQRHHDFMEEVAKRA